MEEELGSGGGDGGLGVHGGGEKKEERAGKQAGRAGGHGGEDHRGYKHRDTHVERGVHEAPDSRPTGRTHTHTRSPRTHTWASTHSHT